METGAVKNDDVVERLRSLEIDRSGEERPRRRFRLLVGVVLCCFAVGAAAYVLWPRNSGTAAPAITVETEITTAFEAEAGAPPAPVGGSDWLAAGYLVAKRESLVSAEVTATVAALFVEAGTSVESGDVIAQLDGSLAEADLRIAASRAEAAERTIDAIAAERREAETFLERVSVLVEDGGISASDFDRAQARLSALTARQRQAEAEHRMAQQESRRARVFLDKHTITAPFAGIVTSCDVEIGETVSQMSANGSSGVGVCTIVDPSSIEIEIDVPETLISRVRPGAEAQAFLDAYPDDALPVRVNAIAPEANREKSTIEVRLIFTEPDPRLSPNMAVKVRLQRSNTEQTE